MADSISSGYENEEVADYWILSLNYWSKIGNGSFRCYDNSDVIATLMMTNFHLNTTVVAIFPNVCLWRRSLCSDFVLTLKNRIEPPSYARTAYVVAIWLSFLFDSFVKIWATCVIFLGKWFTAPPGKKFPVRLWVLDTTTLRRATYVYEYFLS